jgi:hypothetical protein
MDSNSRPLVSAFGKLKIIHRDLQKEDLGFEEIDTIRKSLILFETTLNHRGLATYDESDKHALSLFVKYFGIVISEPIDNEQILACLEVEISKLKAIIQSKIDIITPENENIELAILLEGIDDKINTYSAGLQGNGIKRGIITIEINRVRRLLSQIDDSIKASEIESTLKSFENRMSLARLAAKNKIKPPTQEISKLGVFENNLAQVYKIYEKITDDVATEEQFKTISYWVNKCKVTFSSLEATEIDEVLKSRYEQANTKMDLLVKNRNQNIYAETLIESETVTNKVAWSKFKNLVDIKIASLNRIKETRPRLRGFHNELIQKYRDLKTIVEDRVS